MTPNHTQAKIRGMETIGPTTIHARIKKRREELGMSLEAVGKAAGVSWQAVQLWESTTAPKRTRLKLVAQVLKTSVEYLLYGAGEGAAISSLSPRALEVARLYDTLSPPKQRLLYAQAQVLHNPEDFNGGGEPLDGPPRPGPHPKK